MTLGDRCDEIVRLIDRTLLSVGADTGADDPGAAIDTSTHPSGSRLAARGARPLTLAPPLDLASPLEIDPVAETASVSGRPLPRAGTRTRRPEPRV